MNFYKKVVLFFMFRHDGDVIFVKLVVNWTFYVGFRLCMMCIGWGRQIYFEGLKLW